jgi:two-component system sensor histidine kinase AlgZ
MIRLFNGFKISKVAQHVIFWIAMFILIDIIYSVKSNYLFASYNNLFYLPVYMAYFYALARWLIPIYLLRAHYVKFVAGLLMLIFVSAFICRLIDILIMAPFMLKHLKNIDWSYIALSRRTFWSQLSDPLNFMNSVKGTNLIVLLALVIKLFKLWLERKQAALQAELDALKGQVHPHFLFNTLNNLYALTLTNSPKSPQVVLGLSELLRYMLYECNADRVSLNKEILMLQQFVSLEKLRYEERLDLTFNIYGETDDKLIAPLLMLPLIENAFKHGTSESLGQAWININLYVTGEDLKLKISNSKAEKEAEKHTGHIGLQNLHKRLELLYPATHQLKIMDDDDAFLVVLEVKLTTQTKPAPQLIPA